MTTRHPLRWGIKALTTPQRATSSTHFVSSHFPLGKDRPSGVIYSNQTIHTISFLCILAMWWCNQKALKLKVNIIRQNWGPFFSNHKNCSLQIHFHKNTRTPSTQIIWKWKMSNFSRVSGAYKDYTEVWIYFSKGIFIVSTLTLKEQGQLAGV